MAPGERARGIRLRAEGPKCRQLLGGRPGGDDRVGRLGTGSHEVGHDPHALFDRLPRTEDRFGHADASWSTVIEPDVGIGTHEPLSAPFRLPERRPARSSVTYR